MGGWLGAKKSDRASHPKESKHDTCNGLRAILESDVWMAEQMGRAAFSGGGLEKVNPQIHYLVLYFYMDIKNKFKDKL